MRKASPQADQQTQKGRLPDSPQTFLLHFSCHLIDVDHGSLRAGPQRFYF